MTNRELRRLFWEQHPTLSRRRLSDGSYLTDTRVTWCDWIDRLAQDGEIPQQLADRATLEP